MKTKSKKTNNYSRKYLLHMIIVFLLIVVSIISCYLLKQYTRKVAIERQTCTVVFNTEHNAKVTQNNVDDSNYNDIEKQYTYCKEGDTYILDSNGNVLDAIYSTKSKPINNIFSELNDRNDSVSTLKKQLKQKKIKGTLNLNYNNEESLVCLRKIDGQNDNYIMSVLTYNEIYKNVDSVTKNIFIVIGALFLILIAVDLFAFIREKKCNIALENLIDTDDLTGNISYSKFLEKAQDLLNVSENQKIAIFYGDIKNFKFINDTYGYDVGDRLLIYISNTIKEMLEGYGYYARISGDNFAVIAKYNHKEDFIELIYAALDKFSDFPVLSKENYKLEMYVGVYCVDDFENKPKLTEMIDRANMAQKSIKGSNEYHLAFYNDEIRERIIAEKDIENKMVTALENGEFVVFYQPKYNVKTGEISGAEALVRWNSPERGLLLPGKFIALFEQNGFIVNLDQYVFETVCKNVREWLDKGKKVVPISINVSRIQFYRLDFIKRYTKIKHKYKIPDGLLELEFTESIVLENVELLQKIVNNLKENGFVCSIDDFGSGYSSLNILKNLPMDILKLDKLFFQNSDNLDRDKALIASVVTMARALKMKTVSEGIETWNQVNFLKEIGCDIIQGYVYSEPISKKRFEQLVEGKKKNIPSSVSDDHTVQLEEILKYDDDFVHKYLAALKYSSSTVIETDYKHDTYKVVNLVDIGNYEGIKTTGENINDVFKDYIDKYVHPDDRSSVKQRCLPMGVMSSFYQGEEKIISDFRVLDNNYDDYIWCRATIVRVETDKSDEFRSITFLDNIDEIINLNKCRVATIKTIEEALYEMCGVIYEINFNADKYNLIYCRKSKLGEQPESGDLTWFKNQYLTKMVHPDNLIQMQNFLNTQYIQEQFDSGKRKITTQSKFMVNKDIGYINCNITLIKINSYDDTLRVFAMCQNIEESYKNAENSKELQLYVSHAVCDYYDLVYVANFKNDTLNVVKSNNIFQNINRNFKYKVFNKKFADKYVYYEDRAKVKKFLDETNISTSLKLGKSGESIEYRVFQVADGKQILTNIKTTYMRVACANDNVLFVSRILDSEDGNKIEQDPMKKLYNKETTNFIIERALQKLDAGDKRAFMLLDISKVESLTDVNWDTYSKEDILEEFNERLLDILSDTELVCRTSGYEFVILTDKANNENVLNQRISDICKLLKENLALDSKEYKITGNVGVSIYGKDGINYEKLYLSADSALKKARKKGLDEFSIL